MPDDSEGLTPEPGSTALSLRELLDQVADERVVLGQKTREQRRRETRGAKASHVRFSVN